MLSRALRSDCSNNKSAENSGEDNEPAQPKCEATYDVLTIIFKKLNARDLRNAAKVCRCWYVAATNEKRLRRDSTLTFFGNVNKSWIDSHRGQQFIDQLRMKPMLGFMFADVFNLPVGKNIAACRCGSLPSSCANIIVGNLGLVKGQKEISWPAPTVTYNFLPEEEDVMIKIISSPVEARNSNESAKTSRKRREKNFPIIPDNVNCIIFLTNYHESFQWYPLKCIPRDRYKTLCGGVVRVLAICQRDETGQVCNEEKAWIGILISGPSVRSWSVVLLKTDNTKEKVEAKMRLLKSQVELKKHSVGFVFGCIERGRHMFGENHVESKIFKNLFPQVPLIGTLGEVQYGDSTILPGIVGHGMLLQFYSTE